MKQFKNKNTGEVVKYITEDYYLTSDEIGIPSRFIEGSCDWEEIIKEYEILSFKSLKIKDYALSLKDGGYISIEGSRNVPLQEMLANKNFEILSVKRLSDGEVFTLGDKVSATDNKYSRGNTIINSKSGTWIPDFYNTTVGSFKIIDDIMCVIYSYNNRDYGQPINYVKKLTKPLFKTEDGVEVFCGDSYWCVNTSLHFWSLFKQTARERTMLGKGVKSFSTESLAREYKLLNQPLLSLDDLLSVWNYERDDKLYSSSPLFLSFKELAKTKLS